MTLDLTQYIEDDSVLEMYLNNFDSDTLEEFVSFLNKIGNNKEAVATIFNNFQIFQEIYSTFLQIQE